MKPLFSSDAQLRPLLEQVEDIRKVHHKKVYWDAKSLGAVLPILVVVGMLVGFSFPSYMVGFIITVAFCMPVGFVVLQVTSSTTDMENEAYQQTIKDRLFPALAKAILPDASYSSFYTIEQQQLQLSGLLELANQLDTEHYFSGTTSHACPFQWAYIKLYNKVAFPEIAQHGLENAPLFKGFFFELNQGISIPNPVLILPSNASYQQEQLGTLQVQSLAAFWKKQGWPHRADYFSFIHDYTLHYHKEADLSAVLTLPLLAALNRFQLQWKRYFRVSFVQNKLYILLAEPTSLVTPLLHESILEGEQITHLYAQLSSCFELLENVNNQEWNPPPLDIPSDEDQDFYQHLIVE